MRDSNPENSSQLIQWREHLKLTLKNSADVLSTDQLENLWRQSGSQAHGHTETGKQLTEPAHLHTSTPNTEPAPMVDPTSSALDSLTNIRSDLGDCQRCKLAKTRTNLVFGEGNPTAELMFVGEGPGEQEDEQGRPFVGKAGQLLDKIIEAMGYKREQVYIANVVKCRPPMNRNPEPDEVESCEPFLARQIKVIRPKVLIGLGGVALKSLLGPDTKITQVRGQWQEFQGIPLMPTFHPAYLLRTPDAKKEVWNDMKLVMGKLK